MQKIFLLLTFILSGVFASNAAAPTLKGKMVYHNYTNYGALDSKMYLYDFTSNQLTCISNNWTNISHPMNAHFSPDGTQITFMGIHPPTDSWSIYTYTLGSSQAPVRLSTTNARDEDPKFSPDGKKIAFKRNERIGEMDLATKNITWLTPANLSYSMPYYNPAGTKLVCSKDGGQTSSICLIDIQTKAISVLYDKANVQDYYPIAVDENSFYYAAGYSASNRADQIYRGYWNGQTSVRLPFNNSNADYSDPYPIDAQWLILCSTRSGSKGGYDLYIANAGSTEIYSLSDYNSGINTVKEELGAVYHDSETSILPSGSITYTVQAPPGTNVVYFCNWLSGGGWNWVKMQRVGDGNTFTYMMNHQDASPLDAYFYAAGPGWAYVETDANGNEVQHAGWSELDIIEYFTNFNIPGGEPYYDYFVRYTVQAPPGTGEVYFASSRTGWALVPMQQTTVENIFFIDIVGAGVCDLYSYAAGPTWAYEEIISPGRGGESPCNKGRGLDIVENFKSVNTNIPAAKTSDLVIESENQIITATGDFEEVSVYDVTGRKIQSEKVKNRFESKPINPGIYLIRTDKQYRKIVVR